MGSEVRQLKKVLCLVIAGMLCVLAWGMWSIKRPQEAQMLQDSVKGSAAGAAFEKTAALIDSNGKTVNFWIRNNGTTSVAITINGKGSRTIKPGTEGHISADVGYFTKDYTFKAAPTPNGGDIDIEYKIAQRD